MSADLLAAFGTELSAESTPKSASPPKASSSGADAAADAEDTWQPWPKPQQHLIKQQHEKLWRSQGETHVLFDADDDEDDEFGEFEDPDQGSKTSLSNPVREVNLEASVDLLGLNDIDYAQSSASQGHTAFQRSESQTAGKPIQEDDDWGAFEDMHDSRANATVMLPDQQVGAKSEALESHHAQSTAPIEQQDAGSTEFDEWDEWETTDTIKQSVGSEPQSGSVVAKQIASPQGQERPTNIPPPAVLLSLVPTVLSHLSSNTASSTENGTQVVEAYRVCARLIAGRTLRWKRDTILAQSMRIGAAGRSGGMKLAALDKGESRKENQEVEEALSTWSRLSIKLNAAMSKAKVPKPPLSLSTNIVIRTATGPDIINAIHACPICGLKRNERINGIDVNVSDTFGEFWVEHWGHRDCYDFWYRYSKLLDQR